MSLVIAIFSAFLFFLLCPGILLCLPSRTSNKYTIAMVHATIFGLIIYFSHITTTIIEGRSVR